MEEGQETRAFADAMRRIVLERSWRAGVGHIGSALSIVDANAQQALGHTADVLDLEPLPARWEAFGWDAREVDGHDHDHEAILAALGGLERHGKPRAVIARTTFGKGVSFMAGRIEWRYLPLTDEQYAEAMDELDRSVERV